MTAIQDIPQIAPGTTWLRLFKPWIPRPPASPDAQPAAPVPPAPVFTYGGLHYRWKYEQPGYRWIFDAPQD